MPGCLVRNFDTHQTTIVIPTAAHKAGKVLISIIALQNRKPGSIYNGCINNEAKCLPDNPLTSPCLLNHLIQPKS